MSEIVKIACPHCSAHLGIPAQKMGQRLKCPKCNTAFAPSFSHAMLESRGSVEESAEPKVSWTCPGCFAEFMVRFDGEYDLCPECEKLKVSERHRVATDESTAPIGWRCVSCGEVFDVPFDGEVCPTCEQLGKSPTLPERSHSRSVAPSVTSRSAITPERRTSLRKSADAVRAGSGWLVLLGILSIAGGVLLAVITSKESSFGQTIAVAYVVAGIVEGIVSFAIASGLSAIGNICDSIAES